MGDINNMKISRVVQIVTDTVEEEQFILNKFPEAWWVPTQVRGRTTFSLPIQKEVLVREALNEYEEKKNER